MFREWTCILLLIIFLTFSGPILCFNVNIKNAKLFTGQRDSYFGFSLAFLDSQQGKWLLVGAPKATDSLQPALQAPGGVYKCPLEGNSSSCSWVTIDQTGNQNVTGIYYGHYKKFSPQKSHQLLGMSVAVSPDNQYIMACAPNWKDAANYIWLVSGMCYEVGTSGLGSTRLLPMLVDWSMSYMADATRLWIYALLGFSVQYTQTPGSPVFGAPGMFSFTGGYVVEEDHETNTTVMPQQYKNTDSWFIGYSLATTNRLDRSNNTYIVAGAPKGMMFGTVLVYLYKEKDSRVNNIIGEQISSYFGSVLCVADLNFDGLDDIVVGAPYFSGNKTEEGRVYVWMNKGGLRFEKQAAVLSGSLSRYARFGSALASIGDFNLDTYNDVAIGAPYEEDGVGALYIYNGYRQGLWPRFTQRISGSLLNPGLRAFGGSIGKDPLTSGTTKMFAVGAYDGDHALVLKSSSVVRVHLRVIVIPGVITHETPNVTATICFNYTTRFKDVPEVIEVDYSLYVDTLLGPGSSRSYISPDNVAHLDARVQVATMERCVDHTIITPFQDIEKDLVMSVRYDLSPSLTRQCTRYCLTLEAFNGADPTRVDNREVPMKLWFDKQCGPDNQCQPVLEIDVQPRLSGNATIIVGRDAALFANVTITNSGEMAYSIVVMVTVKARLSSPMRILDTPGRLSLVDCVQTDRSADVNVSGDAYSCFVRRPYPLEDGKNITFPLKFPLENHIHLPTFEANFSVHVGINATYQAGTEMTIPILWSNSVKVESSSEPEDVPVRIDQARDKSTKIVHRYFVRNLGPSPIDGRHVLAFVPVPLTGNYVTLDNDSVSITTYDSGPSQTRSCTRVQGNVTSPLENTVNNNLTCASAPCQRYICPMGMFLKDQSLLVTVRLSVMYSIMDRLKDNTNVYLQTTFNFPKAHKGDDVNIQASTLFYVVSKALGQEDTKVAVWPIIVGAIGALCLLVIAGVVMFKLGCFKRSNKEDMKKKAMTRMSQMYPDKVPRAPEITEASKSQPEELQND